MTVTTGLSAEATRSPGPPGAVPAGSPPSRFDDDPDAARGVVEVVVAGLVRVRLIGATRADRQAVEAQLGPADPATSEDADITLRYVQELAVPPRMRLLGPGEVAVAEDGLVVLRGRFRRPARILLPVDRLGGPCELVCEHGVGRVPHLIAVLNLALLARGGVALHASAVEVEGRAVVATGWSKGGKTEAVLSLLGGGGRLVGDEWLHLTPDDGVTGIREPLRIWDWQLRQLPSVRAAVGRGDRLRLASLSLARTLGRSARLATAIERQRFVDVDGAALAPTVRTAVPRGPVLLMTSAQRSDIAVRPIDGREVADRMTASLTFERGPLLALAEAHRFAFPDIALAALDDAAERERELLRRRLDDAPAAEILHPHPMDLGHLGTVVRAALRDLS